MQNSIYGSKFLFQGIESIKSYACSITNQGLTGVIRTWNTEMSPLILKWNKIITLGMECDK